MSPAEKETCCPRFDPVPWDGREIIWKDKLFYRERVRSFLHIPLNFGAVMRRSMAALEAAGAQCVDNLALSDENTLWSADLYLAVDREVPGGRMTPLSGTFFCKVYEGPYSNMRHWIADMTARVKAQGRELRRLLFYYTTCPRCAKKYGKNYIVILAQV